MAIRVLAQRNALAAQYATAAPNATAFSSDPGTSGSATGELTGGSPAFARKAITGNWSTATASASAVTGSATFDVASGSTVAYVGVTVSLTLTTADVRDSVAVTSQAFSSQGTYAAALTYTQT